MRSDRKFNAFLLEIAEREQRRLAEDLHDSLCQNLVGISLLMKLAVRRAESGRKVALADLQKINGYVDEAIEHARAPLRTQFLSQTEMGLVKALQDLARIAGRKLDCKLEIAPDVMIRDPRVAQVLYRIAADAVRELTRRARSTRVVLKLAREEEGVRLEVLGEGGDTEGDFSQDDELLQRFADAAGIRLTIERDGGCFYRAVAPDAER